MNFDNEILRADCILSINTYRLKEQKAIFVLFFLKCYMKMCLRWNQEIFIVKEILKLTLIPVPLKLIQNANLRVSIKTITECVTLLLILALS